MSPIGRKVFGLGPLHVPLAYSLALHHRARHPRRRLSPRLAWSRKSTSLASLLPRSSASAYGGSVDFRSHCTRQCATGGGVSILPRAFRGDVLLHSSLIYSSGSGDSSPIAKLHRCRPRWRASLLLH